MVLNEMENGSFFPDRNGCDRDREQSGADAFHLYAGCLKENNKYIICCGQFSILTIK